MAIPLNTSSDDAAIASLNTDSGVDDIDDPNGNAMRTGINTIAMYRVPTPTRLLAYPRFGGDAPIPAYHQTPGASRIP